MEVGVIAVQEIEDEADGPCRDINYDPTVLPDGISVSDDPFPAARSAVYAKSFDRRTAEEADYPHCPYTGVTMSVQKFSRCSACCTGRCPPPSS